MFPQGVNPVIIVYVSEVIFIPVYLVSDVIYVLVFLFELYVYG